MTAIGAYFLAVSVLAAQVALLVAFALILVRLAKGPSLPDRLVALDLMTVVATGFILVLAVANGEKAFLDVALALGLMAFLATVAFARYVLRRGLAGVGDSVETDASKTTAQIRSTGTEPRR